MSKAKFDAAKELITERKYAEARAILKTIDHPTAREWETKIDKLTPLPPLVTKPTQKHRRPWPLLIIGGCTLACILTFAVASNPSVQKMSQETQTAKFIVAGNTNETATVLAFVPSIEPSSPEPNASITLTPTTEVSTSNIPTSTIAASATITNTPAPTAEPTAIPGSLKSRTEIGGTMAVPLSAAFLQVNGVESVNIAVVPLEDGKKISVGGKAKIAKDSDMLRIATEMRDLSYSTLFTAFLDFWVILDDGSVAVDYTWNNANDSWQITPLSSQSSSIKTGVIVADDNTSSEPDLLVIVPVTYYAESQVNVRSCPRTNCDRVGQVEPNTAMTVDAVINGDEVQDGNVVWYRVKYEGKDAFVYSGLMLSQLPKAEIVQQSVAPPVVQQPVASGYNGPIPKNCTEARAMGIDQYTAAQINPNLDRDDDGKACYDDQ